MSIRPRRIGFSRRLSQTRFRVWSGFLVGRPLTRESQVHSLVPLSPLRSSFAVPPCRRPPFGFGSTRPAGGFFPLRGVTSGVHSSRGAPAPATFRPQVFSTSRRLPPPFGFAGLLHPAATSRVLRSGASPAEQPGRLVAGPCLLAVVVSSLTGFRRLPRCDASTSGL